MNMVEMSYAVAGSVEEAVARYELPQQLGFGVVPAPVMYSVDYATGGWARGVLMPFGEISILPNARGIQFAECVFEGMKAYRRRPAPPHLFRPTANHARFVESARRIGMPAVPEALFMEAVGAVVSACGDIVPDASGSALYLRPFMFSTEPGYSVSNSNTYRFMVIASPSEVYSSGSMRVMIERNDVRAARGGVGFAKTGGNYAAAMKATSAAMREGFTVALWLDPTERSAIEELSGMNVFAVIDGELQTPELSDSILPGITRDCVITLARNRGIVVREKIMPIAELLRAIRAGRCREVFATGTAAIITPVSELGDSDGQIYVLPDSQIALQLRSELLDIQERRAPDPLNWTYDIPLENGATRYSSEHR